MPAAFAAGIFVWASAAWPAAFNVCATSTRSSSCERSIEARNAVKTKNITKAGIKTRGSVITLTMERPTAAATGAMTSNRLRQHDSIHADYRTDQIAPGTKNLLAKVAPREDDSGVPRQKLTWL
jgi:hypothetical protein